MKLGHVNRGLIDLPLSLPSIPIVNPLVTALVGDSNQGTTSAAHVTTTASPPTTSGGGGSGGSSQGSGGSSQGSGSGSQGSGSGSSQGSGDSGSGSTTYSGSGSDSGSGQSNDGTSNTGSKDGTGSSDSSPTHGSHSIVANAGNQPPSGLAGALTATDSNTTAATKVTSNGTPVATHTTLPSGSGNVGSGTPGTNGGDGNDGSGDGTSSSNNSGNTSGHGGLSTGAIAGIVVVALILGLSLVIVYLRKRSKAQRTERRRRWWLGKTQADETYRWSGNGTGDATLGSGGSGVMSARSSFATTFDHASGELATLTLDFTNVAPPMPPMAELRDAHGPGLLLHSQDHGSPVLQSPVLVNVTDPDCEQRRVSTYSNRSSSSDSHAQYLSYTDPFITKSEGHSPMSVRSFSPSDLFSFPKPPTNDIPKPPNNDSPTPESPNPFADPTEDGTIEIVRRPFTPTLHDEIGVSIGDRVRISKVFDDGWALIEKYPAGSGEKGKAKQIQGLIPVDCLREAGEDLPAFLASKRISSYGTRGVAA